MTGTPSPRRFPRTVYAHLLAVMLSGADSAQRLALWRDLEAQYVAAYLRAHPTAGSQAARRAFAALAKRIIVSSRAAIRKAGQRERAARLRQRRKQHRDVVCTVALKWANIDYLIASGLLARDQVDDRDKIGAAVERAMDVLRKFEKIANAVTP
jgi:hypothetical protein